MIVLWITLLFLHRGYSLVPVKTIQLGEPATLTCALPKGLQSGEVHWYKQRVGDTLKLIMTLFKSATPLYGPEFSKSRMTLSHDNNFSNLTILNTVKEDEGIYHCGLTEWIRTNWSGTYLFVKGKTLWGSKYTVIQQPTESNLLRSGDTATLQCSVLSDSENSMCPGDHNVFWFRAGSQKSHPKIIYTDGNRRSECGKINETQKRCVYSLPENISSSDAGTYYCAVATCGEILFGNGTNLELVVTTQLEFIQMAILIVCLAISVFGNVFLCYQRGCKRFKGTESAMSEAQTDNLHQTTEADYELNYAALNFSERKSRGRRKREFTEDSVYSQVKH